MPADLPERIRFSLALRDLEIEVARLAEEDQLTVAARGAEQSRTITFDSDSLTIMIRIDANQDGTVRVDGWLAPPQRREIEMKTAADTLSATSDEQGRFAFARVPRGNGSACRPGRTSLARADRAVRGDPRAHPLTGSPGRRLPDVPRRTALSPLRSARSPAPRAGPARRVSAACGRATPAARPSAPATSARGCGNWAGRKTGDSPTRGRCLRRIMPWPPGCWGSLAIWESEQGRTEYGLSLLDRAESLAAPDDRGILLLQRGLIFMRTGAGRRRGQDTRRRGGPAGGKPGGDREPGHLAAQSQLRPPQRSVTSGGLAPTWPGAAASRRTKATT